MNEKSSGTRAHHSFILVLEILSNLATLKTEAATRLVPTTNRRELSSATTIVTMAHLLPCQPIVALLPVTATKIVTGIVPAVVASRGPRLLHKDLRILDSANKLLPTKAFNLQNEYNFELVNTY
jgi:hypothetical protein